VSAGEGHGDDPFEPYAGAYVLGALPERDAADFALHLEGCPACARSVAEVAHLPALLDRVPAADVRRLARKGTDDDPVAFQDDLGPPPTLLPALLSRAGVAGRQRRWRSVAALAAAAAAGVVVLAGLQAMEDRFDGSPQAQRPAQTAPATTPSTRPATSVVLRPVGSQPVTAAVRMEEVGWGTKIELTCAYAGKGSQYPAGTAYSLVVADGFGHRQQVATWKAIAGRTLTVPAATSLTPPGIRRVEVRGSDGQVLLTASP
jgi:Putative zinc-finger